VGKQRPGRVLPIVRIGLAHGPDYRCASLLAFPPHTVLKGDNHGTAHWRRSTGFHAPTTEGTIHFHEWIGDSWAILCSRTRRTSPRSAPPNWAISPLKPEFDKRNTKVIGLSIDSVDDHQRWAGDIAETQGRRSTTPLIGDTELVVAKLYDMIHPNASGNAAGRTAVDNATVRSVFLIGPDKKIKLTMTYPMSAGRNFSTRCCARSTQSSSTPSTPSPRR
jgi:alkyl hydroperoxide reductase subunit AhpC